MKQAKKQAKISGEYLKKFYFNDDSESTAESTADSTIMFVSPDDRAYETAKIIADVNNIDDSNIQNINLLKGCSVNRIENVNIEKEYDYADLVKIHKNTIKSRKDPIEKHKITNFHSFTRKHYDKMESYGIQVEHPESLSKRCDNVVDMITSTPHDNVILVSHSSFLNSFMQNMFGVEWAATGKNKIENSSLSLIECKGNKCTMNTPLNNCHLSFKDKDTN